MCSSINKDIIIDYSLYLKDLGNINQTTQNTYLRHLRVFLYYCMEMEYIKPFHIKIKNSPVTNKDVYTQSELEILLKKPDIKKCDFSEYRNWVITNFLLGTAVRLSTLRNIKISDLDFDNLQISLREVKNKTPYCIPMSNSLKLILIEYLQIRKGYLNDYLFCTDYGEQMNKSSIQHAIIRYNNRRGITKTSIHLYRHTFVKYWLLNEGNIYELQRILGHKSLNMVTKYANYYGIDLNKNFESHNILSNISNKGKKIHIK